ncbi:DeoR family transcriptional regulator [Photobacterium leiognathi]|uniref:DeoR family transcriptional regulator n=1 Tax=Photobacterium leiognathi TaxID=553611 RepID=UPI002739638F|nr:DeoR family transcriptional regulator [Photobacterium leiognathi]
MKQIPRHQEIVELVMKQGYVSTEELVERFNVSPQTIRRDLNELADANKIRRYHGGATTPLSSENTSYNTRKSLHFSEKDLIAANLVKHIPDGASLFIDIGTTPEAVARALCLQHKQFRLDFGILGISGIDNDGSLLDFDYHKVRVKQAIIENSRRVFLAVDHSKFGRNAMVKLGNISQVDALFTDMSPPEHILSIINEHQIRVEVTTSSDMDE